MEEKIQNLEYLEPAKRMEAEKQLLQDNGIRVSHQRLLILDYLSRNHKHPSAETIFTDLKKIDPVISQATVYNTLKIFTGKNIVKELDFNLTSKRYEFAKDCHSHFICENCGKIIDLKDTNDYKIDELADYEIKSVDITYRGLCPDCK